MTHICGRLVLDFIQSLVKKISSGFGLMSLLLLPCSAWALIATVPQDILIMVNTLPSAGGGSSTYENNSYSFDKLNVLPESVDIIWDLLSFNPDYGNICRKSTGYTDVNYGNGHTAQTPFQNTISNQVFIRYSCCSWSDHIVIDAPFANHPVNHRVCIRAFSFMNPLKLSNKYFS